MCFVRLMVVFLVVGLLGGCGGRSGGVSVKTPQQSPAEAAKVALKDMADTGRVGSQVMTVRDNLEKIKTSEPEKATALLKDLNELSGTSNPAAVKTKAKAMMEKL